MQTGYTPILRYKAGTPRGSSHPLSHEQGTKGSTYLGCHIDIGATVCQQDGCVK